MTNHNHPQRLDIDPGTRVRVYTAEHGRSYYEGTVYFPDDQDQEGRDLYKVKCDACVVNGKRTELERNRERCG